MTGGLYNQLTGFELFGMEQQLFAPSYYLIPGGSLVPPIAVFQLGASRRGEMFRLRLTPEEVRVLHNLLEGIISDPHFC